MKSGPNNEMDLILRKHGRAATAGEPNGGASPYGSGSEQHLDVDELNAYAENALPPAARARYTAHLADCNRCRQIVAQLSLAAAAGIRQIQPVHSTSGWKAFLTSLFSPMVLRYAAPALALICFASIALIVYQRSYRQEPHKSTAQFDERLQNQPVSVPSSSVAQRGPDVEVPNSSVAQKGPDIESHRAVFDKNKSTDSQAKSSDDRERDVSGAKKPAEEKPATQPTAAKDQGTGSVFSGPPRVETAAEPAKKMADDKTEAKVDAGERTKQAAAAAPAATTGVSDTVNVKGAAKEQANDRRVDRLSVGGVANPKSKTESRGQAENEEQTRVQGRSYNDQQQTKSVGGRHFRKEGSVWIDTTYSSQSIVNVARGSEQYRALVADEPTIKTIADELGGEVVLVWKGRAYRIK